MPPLHDCVDEMRRADHDPVDRAARHLGVAAQQTEGGDDAAGHILGRRRFDRMDDLAVLQ